MKRQLLLHCGGRPASLAELQAVPLPPATATYQPISHYDLVLNIERVARDMLHNHRFSQGSYALSKDGLRLFGVLTYNRCGRTETDDDSQQSNDTQEMGLSIGLRNSYNKTLSVGIAIGATVCVCDNLAFTGEITVLRKHTQNVIDDLETAILKVLYKAKLNFTSIVESAKKLKVETKADD